MQNICALIPAYNEEKNIGSLVRGLLSMIKNVVVVDDGSSDRTARRARESGAVVLRYQLCRGKGAALRMGYDFCLSQGFDAVLNLDGDGQHDWREAEKFFKIAAESKTGIIIGNRMGDIKGMPRLRLLTNRVTSSIISFLVKQKIEDSQCGYRLVQRPVLEKVKLCTAHFDTESELLIKAGRLGFKIISVPIDTIYRGEVSKINRVLDTCRFIRLIWRSLWRQK